MAFRSRWGFRKAGHSTLTGVTRNKTVKIDEFEKEYQAFVEKLKQDELKQDVMTTTETVVEEVATEIVEPVKDEQVETDVNESVDIQQDTAAIDEETEVSSYKKKKRK